MRRVFLIRAGNDAEHIDAMRAAGLIGLDVPTVGDVRGMTPLEIEQALASGGQSAGAGAMRAILQVFANDLRLGDLVVSPNNRRREVWVGAVAGGYEHTEHPTIGGCVHTRAVDWFGWLDRDAVWMRDQSTSLDRAPVMYELSSREWWLRQLDSREFTTTPRTVWSTAPAKATRTRSGTSRPATQRPATPRSPAAPKPPARKPPAALVRCAGSCGFLWAPTSLVDGLCADCRND